MLFRGMSWPRTGQIALAAFFPTSVNPSNMTSKPHRVYDPKPVAYKAVRVWLPDGSRTLGIWTGVKWWSTKGEIQPVKWELEERKKKTEKLRKAIARKN